MAKTAISDWAATAGDNTDVAGINIDEGMAPSDVNNALRAMMAQLRSWYDQEHVGQVRWFGYDGPAGNWLACDGAAYDSVTNGQYAALYARIGTTFGGTGPTDFKVPDLRGRSPMGAGQGDTAEGGGPGTSRALGDKAGKETHTLTAAEMSAHSHDAGTLSAASAGAHTHNVKGLDDRNTPGGSNDDLMDGDGPDIVGATEAAGAHSHAITGSTGSAGSGSGHAIQAPVTVLRACIGY